MRRLLFAGPAHFATGLAALVLAVALIVSACGDDNGDAGDPTPAGEPTAPAQAPGDATATPGASRTPGSVMPPIVYEARSAADGSTNVYTIDAHGENMTPLTADAGFSGHPGWSPDYTRVVFVTDRDASPGTYDVWVMDADGTHGLNLTNTPGATEWSPKFSPDGTRITYVEIVNGEGSYLMVMDADGSGRQRLAGPYKFAEFPAWTRDGAEIWFAAIEQQKNDVDIYAVAAGGGEVRVEVATPSSDLCPHFTRDGRYVTYATAAPGEPGNIDLYIREIDSDDTTGETHRRLTTEPGTDDYMAPAPDSSLYVYLARRENGTADLWIMDGDFTNPRPLTNTPDLLENVPDW